MSTEHKTCNYCGGEGRVECPCCDGRGEFEISDRPFARAAFWKRVAYEALTFHLPAYAFACVAYFILFRIGFFPFRL